MNKTPKLLLLLILSVFLLFACDFSEAAVPVSSIEFKISSYEFNEIGQKAQIVAVINDDATERSLVWESSDESVATVTNFGQVTAVSDGSAFIYAKSLDGTVTAVCTVNVTTFVELESISLSVTEYEFTAFGEVLALHPTVLPENATNKTVLWSSSNPSVVSVDSNGVAVSLSNGAATIMASNEGNTVFAICVIKVTVDLDVPMTDVNFDISEYTFTSFDETLVLTPVWEPEHTTERGLTWSSSDKNVAVVDAASGTVTPKANGTATIYAVADNRLKQAVCKITVDAYMPVTEITLSSSSAVLKTASETYQIIYSLLPSNASDKSMSFISTNTSVATVDENGLITAVGNGEAKIVITALSGGVSAEFAVTVDIPSSIPVTGIAYTSKTYTFAKIGDSMTLSYTVSPQNATDKSVSFSSSDADIISVDQNGKITALKEGTSVITIKTSDGSFTDNFVAIVSEQTSEEPENPSSNENENIQITIGAASDDLRGLWIATVSNIDFPSKPGLSADELRAEIDVIVQNAYEWGMNAIFFQVRPKSDALYKSEIFPTADCLVSVQGDPLTLDCLEYFITAAHAKGIELHAWINPYRVLQSGTNGHNLNVLSDTNPAKKNPSWVVKHSDGATYYNPGIPEVRQLVVDGVIEIVKNYNIDGIHFDDYFYPYTNGSTFADSAEYNKYKSENQTLADWRRQNNDLLIEAVAAAVKSIKSDVAFGVSPCGVWAMKTNNPLGTDIKSSAESYYQIYADTRKWVVNEWIDYICPQIYWEIDHSTAPFKPITDWWNDVVAGTKVKLYIGIAAYKGSSAAAYSTPKEIQNQIAYANSKENVNGVVFFSYRDIVKNTAGIKDTLKSLYGKETTETPSTASAASDKLVLCYSKLTVENSTSKTFIIGVSDPNYPLIINGTEVTTRSPMGYFTYYVDVPKVGENYYKIEHKDETVNYVITKKAASTEATTMSSFGFVSGSQSPKYDFANVSGTKLTFSCIATAGSTVYAILGDYRIDLTSTVKDSTDGSFKRAWYEGSFILPEVSGNVILGKPIFYIEKAGQTTKTIEGGNVIEVINDPSTYVVEFIKDVAQLKPDLSVTGEEYLFATLGAFDTVVSKTNNNTKLGSGYYTLNENVKRLENTSIPQSAIGSITVEQSADGKYTNIIIPTDSKTMHALWMNDNSVDITLYNLSAIPASFVMPQNPLFSDVTVTRINASTAKITLQYKEKLHIYGYKNAFESGRLVIGFKNPVSLYSSEDYPLFGIKISIDPGHSESSGALGPWGEKKWYEQEWNYKLSSLVNERLIKLGATTHMTHNLEQTKSLDEIIEIFRDWSPDLNISIHFNYVGETSNPINTSGTVTYYSFASAKLYAQIMLEKFTQVTGLKMNTAKIGYFKVSMFPDFPSILFETAFLSNIYDYEWFTDDKNMEKAADAIVEGICEYFRVQ